MPSNLPEISLGTVLEPSGAHGQPVWSMLFQEDNFRELEEAFEKGLEGCHAGEPTGTVMALLLFARAKTCNLYPRIIQHSCGMLRKISLFDLFLDDVLAYLWKSVFFSIAMLDYQRVNATFLVHLLLVQSHCALPLKVNKEDWTCQGPGRVTLGCRYAALSVVWGILYGYMVYRNSHGQWPITTVPQPMDQNPSLSDPSFAITQDRERLEIYKEVQRNLRERLKLTAEAPRRIARGWWGTSRFP